MIHFAVALALLLHVLLWGAGLAMLAMPRRWAAFWPALIVPAGFALQSAVVWAGAQLNLAGTNSYALGSEIVPVALLVWALRRRGLARVKRELRRMSGLLACTVVCLLILVLPLVSASPGLTTISLGSCDAADYAAGARTMMEFARGDRGGFLGLTEVVRVQSVDNFFDYWLRLNHFTPAALIALNGSVLQCAPHELTSIMTMLIVAGTLPLVFWIARAIVRLRSGPSVLVACLYGVSPVTWYAVAHVAPGQLLAALAIGLLTWAGVALWRSGVRGRSWLHFAGVLAIGYWLVLGSYNFIVAVCLVPAVAYAGGIALARGQWARLARWTGAMLLPLAACAVVFWDRTAGLAERVTLLRSYDFGWPIPALTPEGWLGFIGVAPLLGPLAPAWRWSVLALLLVALAAALWRRRGLRWRALALAVPALMGYAYLQWRATALGTNASYDAYKLLAVFFPGILAASLAWLCWIGRFERRQPWAIALAALVIVAHAQSLSQYYHALKAPPLRVGLELRDVRRLEAMPDVASVNLFVPDMWSRLWANALLLRKPQYFPTHTYEARLNTPLRGEWDLQGGLAEVRVEGGAREVSPRFSLVDTRNPAHVRVRLAEPQLSADGWHAEEINQATGERFRWTKGDAIFHVENPHPYPLTLNVTLDSSSVVPRDVVLQREGGSENAAARLEVDRRARPLPALIVPPGKSALVLHLPQPPTLLPGDARPLGLCVYGITLDARR